MGKTYPFPIIDFDKMKEICLAPVEYFERYGDVVKGENGMRYFYKDNGCSTIAVAHLDSVATSKHFEVVETPYKTEVVFNASLDDRLGAYVILELLPSLGIKSDILLTEGEEIGKSTAGDFKTEKKYNWIYEFDRKGFDTVLYQFDDAATRAILKKYSFIVEPGMKSDIAYMEHLGCKGFNFGVGYHNYHCSKAYAIMAHMLYNVRNLQKFYDDYKDTHLPHKKREYVKPRPIEERVHVERCSSCVYGYCYSVEQIAAKKCYACLSRMNNAEPTRGNTAIHCIKCGQPVVSINSKYCVHCKDTAKTNARCVVCGIKELRTFREKENGLCNECLGVCSMCERELTDYMEINQGICWDCLQIHQTMACM